MSDKTDKKPSVIRGSGERIRVNLNLSAATHRALKSWCAGRGVTLQGGLERMLDQAVARMIPKDGG